MRIFCFAKREHNGSMLRTTLQFRKFDPQRLFLIGSWLFKEETFDALTTSHVHFPSWPTRVVIIVSAIIAEKKQWERARLIIRGLPVIRSTAVDVPSVAGGSALIPRQSWPGATHSVDAVALPDKIRSQKQFSDRPGWPKLIVMKASTLK